MAEVQLCEVAEGAPGLRADFATIPANVREDRHLDRQRTEKEVELGSAPVSKALPPSVSGEADAGTDSALVIQNLSFQMCKFS